MKIWGIDGTHTEVWSRAKALFYKVVNAYPEVIPDLTFSVPMLEIACEELIAFAPEQYRLVYRVLIHASRELINFRTIHGRMDTEQLSFIELRIGLMTHNGAGIVSEDSRFIAFMALIKKIVKRNFNVEHD